MNVNEEQLVQALQVHFSELTARSMYRRGITNARVSAGDDRQDARYRLLQELIKGVQLYLTTEDEKADCVSILADALNISNADISTEQLFSSGVRTGSSLSVAPSPMPKGDFYSGHSQKQETTWFSRGKKGSLAFPSDPESDDSVDAQLLRLLKKYLSDIIAKSVLKKSITCSVVDTDKMTPGDTRRLIEELESSISVYVTSPLNRASFSAALLKLLGLQGDNNSLVDITVIQVRNEIDIVTARQKAQEIARSVGFQITMQTKIATAVSELTRNIVQYVGTGKVTIAQLPSTRPGIEISALDSGAGIPHLDEVLSGNYVSKLGMGKGLRGTKRMMDYFNVETSPSNGTQITIRKYLD